MTTKGKAAHGSMPEKGDSAILKLNKAISSIDSFSKVIKKTKHPLLGHQTLNIGCMKGGNTFNTVPDYAKLEIDMRILSSTNINALIKQFRRTIKPAKLLIYNKYKAVELNSDSPTVRLMQDALRQNKLNPNPIGVKFTTQFSELSKYNIQGLVFGVGSVKQAHKPDEFVLLKDLVKCHNVFSGLIKKIQG